MTDKDLHPSSTHPPLPPTPEDEQFARLRLLRSRRVGISTYKRLLAEHGTAQNALAALPEVARAAGVSGYEICPEDVVRAELRAGRAAGARLLILGSSPYPAALAELDDAPPFLWMIGQTDVLSRPMISLVGARNASSLGTRMAKALAKDLAKAGFVVVSGLARGIDAAAHHAALETGTIAVQAGGIDVMYPAENTELAGLIPQNGLRLSEQPMGLQPKARHFPARNRIISGLSRATVVVEAAGKSGSLITARDALDQGREVLAVPGHPFDARASGCNMLIRDGAVLVRSAADVLEALAPTLAAAPELPLPASDAAPAQSKTAPTPQPGKAKRSLRETASLHLQILSRLGPSPVAEDQLIRDLKAPAGQVGPALVDLEMDGQITRRPGGLVAKAV
ncbi:DNA-protecting protein DprA [Sulfitobacter mediterraneus]|uniref:DNA-processing protein DprA n=1 Tax=Sulfitobacter mediterraneus TaxID=83219 RepID=UPI0019343239|nr:DNA-processing protein DprA [Sulfitobacter mediterraneus]MBM1631272.1 DNA-protecting protein DprA [Sulfitobacter mediterraneus]MBM1639085.1 DNA-protecting protein DprA [Sulfitobacter mediterraneus]MBM1643134.1 DNA-protecting protein DprA [Sulfitobacter mediterraneus]MBM1647182.1 DNA-protecting protein DprA [Sulfitobacter mediterraneus]MBM1651225.1 DNA-protecting protein DprA [Sulfitobacter mediterraneus]